MFGCTDLLRFAKWSYSNSILLSVISCNTSPKEELSLIYCFLTILYKRQDKFFVPVTGNLVAKDAQCYATGLVTVSISSKDRSRMTRHS